MKIFAGNSCMTMDCILRPKEVSNEKVKDNRPLLFLSSRWGHSNFKKYTKITVTMHTWNVPSKILRSRVFLVPFIKVPKIYYVRKINSLPFLWLICQPFRVNFCLRTGFFFFGIFLVMQFWLNLCKEIIFIFKFALIPLTLLFKKKYIKNTLYGYTFNF